MKASRAAVVLVAGTISLVAGAVGIVFADGSCEGIAISGGIICSGSCPTNPGGTCSVHSIIDPELTMKWCSCIDDTGPCCTIVYTKWADGTEDFDVMGGCGPGGGDPACPPGECTRVHPGSQYRAKCL